MLYEVITHLDAELLGLLELGPRALSRHDESGLLGHGAGRASADASPGLLGSDRSVRDDRGRFRSRPNPLAVLMVLVVVALFVAGALSANAWTAHSRGAVPAFGAAMSYNFV